MSDKIIPVSYQGLSTEFCINPHFAQDVNFKPVAIKEKVVKTSHTVKDGRKHFPYFLASFYLRLIGFLVMLVLSILLYIVGSWFASGQVAAGFLRMNEVQTIVVNKKLSYAAGTFCLIISLYLLGSATVLGNLMFAKRDLSQLKSGKKMSNGPNKFTNKPAMAGALKSKAQK